MEYQSVGDGIQARAILCAVQEPYGLALTS